MQYPNKWEEIIPGELQRMRVVGGWLVRTYTKVLEYNKDYSCSEALAFVPDKDSEWVVEK